MVFLCAFLHDSATSVAIIFNSITRGNFKRMEQAMPVSNSRQPGFHQLSPRERIDKIIDTNAGIKDSLLDLGTNDQTLMDLADGMIENAVGVMQIPLGIAPNFLIDGQDYMVPMVIEEPSVVAAASKMALIARKHGGFITSTDDPIMIGQIQIVETSDPYAARLRLLEARDELLTLANAQDPVLVRVGGGARNIEVRILPLNDGDCLVLHLLVDVKDAMGANAVNTMVEALAPRVAVIAEGRSLLRILSNRADRRLTRARATFDAVELGGKEVVADMVAGCNLAIADPYRAATHNKGIMNGISAVVLATGNDTRAVEAGAHSYAVVNGRYTSLSHFEQNEDGNLVATLELPMAVGLVGGATSTHPVARAAVRLLGVSTARELASVIVAVGLAQNVGALRALASEGIQRGHMALHARNVAIAAGAERDEIDAITKRLIAEGKVRRDRAEDILEELRRPK
jgi:hydroxymethylglutaryl-CoA reductase